jgi:hypothetical protein
MNALKLISIFALLPVLAHGADKPAPRDGQRDFDWEIGTWQTHLNDCSIRSPARPVGWSTRARRSSASADGRANLVELEVKGPAGAIEALSLRLYNPESRQWSLNFSNSRGGTMTIPAIGEFKNGRGEFYNQDTLDGRSIFVKFVIHCESADVCRFEQSFSGDGGQTWEANWVATDTRVK